MDIDHSDRRPPAGFLRLSNDTNQLVVVDANGVRYQVVTSDHANLVAPFAGEPVNAVAGVCVLGAELDDNALTVTMVTKGAFSLDWQIVVVVDGIDTDLSVVVGNDKTITINLATDGVGDATSTAAQVTTALEAFDFITVADTGASDGTGVMIAETQPFTLGEDGTPAMLGRLASDGTDVWTALVSNPTVTQDGWVKTFTATP